MIILIIYDTLYLKTWVFRLQELDLGPIDLSWFDILFLYSGSWLFIGRRCQHQSTDRENDEETEIIVHKSSKKKVIFGSDVTDISN